MTLEQRVDALEHRSEHLRRGLRRYRGATMVMALVLIAGVTMGQGTRDVEFGTVTCTQLEMVDNEGNLRIVAMGGSPGRGGIVATYSPEGKMLVVLGGGPSGNGTVSTFTSKGGPLVMINSREGEGLVGT